MRLPPVLLAAALALLPVLTYPLWIFDEGVALVAAQRILQGDWPYRDFYAVYPPGQFAMLAAVFKLFGATLTVERLYHLACQVALVAMLVRWSGSFLVVPPAVLLCAWVPSFGYAAIPGLALAMAGMTARAPLLAGALVGFAVVWKLELGVWAGLGTTIGWLVAWPGFRFALRWAAGAGGVVAATLAVLVAAMPWMTIRRQLFDIPSQITAAYHHLPLPTGFSRISLAAYGPLAVALAGLVAGAWLLRRDRKEASAVLAVAVWLALITMQALWLRPDPTHMLNPLLVALALAGRASRRYRFARDWRVGTALVLLTLPAILQVRYYPDGAIAPQQQAALNEVSKLTQPGDPIYVGTHRHDVLHINDISFYFLARRRPASYYHELPPGVATTEEVQRTIARAIELTNTRVVVLWDYARADLGPSSSRKPGSTYLDQYLAGRFQPVYRNALYTVLERRQ
jgi:hypothetical protein